MKSTARIRGYCYLEQNWPPRRLKPKQLKTFCLFLRKSHINEGHPKEKPKVFLRRLSDNVSNVQLDMCSVL